MKQSVRFIQSIFILVILISACSAPITPQPGSNEIIQTPSALPSPTEILAQDMPAPTSTSAILSTDPQAETVAAIPEGALSLVAIGDSLTQGDGDESGLNGYPTRLAEKISSLRPGTTMVNLGKSGWTSIDLLNGANGEAAILPQALEAKPDIALVWIGSNDLWYLYEYGPDPLTSEAEQQDLENYAANIDAILAQFSQAGTIVFIALLDDQSKRPVVANPPNPSEPAFSAITADDLARMSAHASAMNAIIQEKAIKYNAVTVDFYNTDIFTNPGTLYGDGNHPNTAGYEIITETWFSVIEKSLK